MRAKRWTSDSTEVARSFWSLRLAASLLPSLPEKRWTARALRFRYQRVLSPAWDGTASGGLACSSAAPCGGRPRCTDRSTISNGADVARCKVIRIRPQSGVAQLMVSTWPAAGAPDAGNGQRPEPRLPGQQQVTPSPGASSVKRHVIAADASPWRSVRQTAPALQARHSLHGQMLHPVRKMRGGAQSRRADARTASATHQAFPSRST